MFGMSLGETALILLVAVIAIGPKELPTVIRAVVRTLAQLRGVAQEFRKNFDELAQEAEIQDIKNGLVNMPTIIDLEGKPQRVYDISDELKKVSDSRLVLPKPEVAETPAEDKP